MSEQFKAAFLRAIAGAFFTALVVIGPALTMGQETEQTIRLALQAMIAYLIARGIAEGWYDTSRNEVGDVKPSDVK